MQSNLLQQLEDIPAFCALKQGFHQNLNADNFYFSHFLPSTASSDDASAVTEAIQNLSNDQEGYFSEFVHEDRIREDVTEFIRFIFKELYK